VNLPFVKYFFGYLIHAKTRQKLLFIAIFGLVISPFALLVLQSTMGGLQGKLIGRSKEVLGSGVLSFNERETGELKEVTDKLQSLGVQYYPELELELLIKYRQYYAPMIVHGIALNGLPEFLKDKDFKDLILPRPLALKINATTGDLVRLMSPAHLDGFLGDVPRMSSQYIDYMISSEVPEVDDFHGWSHLLKIQSLVGKKVVNKIRIFGQFDEDDLRSIVSQSSIKDLEFKTWEEIHSTLVWALGLETTVMIFLFSVMTLLVSLAITSGLLIFFSKIKGDLASFWIMGTSEKNVFQSSKIFLVVMTFFCVLAGLGLGVLFLYLLDYFGPNVMPDVFVDRRIPVKITTQGLLVSFTIPFCISYFFAWLSLNAFKKDVNYITYIRSIGN